MNYILVWREKPGGLIATYADKEGKPQVWDADPLETTTHVFLSDDKAKEHLFTLLDRNLDNAYAITPQAARNVLGWDL